MTGVAGAPPSDDPDQVDVDLLVRAGVMATMNPSRDVVRDGAVAVTNGRIVAVGKSADLQRTYTPVQVIDLPDGLLTPGLIDGHNHPHDYLLRGIVDDVGDVRARTTRYVGPFDYGITGEEAYVSSRANFAEMLLNGTTSFCDAAGPHPDAVARAAIDSGIRGIVAHQTSDVPGPFQTAAGEIDAILARSVDVVARWNGAADGRIQARLALDLPLSVTDELCTAVVEQAQALEVGIVGHFHGLRSDAHHGGRNPHVERYESLGVLSCKPALTHIGWLPAEDIAVFARNGVGAVHCPTVGMFGGLGTVAHGCIPELVAAGVPVALGSDAACVSRFLDLVRVMYLAACAHRDAREDPLVIGAHKAFEMATIGGARALSDEEQIGSLEPGKLADLVVFDTSGPEWQPRSLDNPIADLVYSATGRSAHTVVVGGEVVVDAGRLTTMDAAVLTAETDHAATEALARLGFATRSPWPVS